MQPSKTQSKKRNAPRRSKAPPPRLSLPEALRELEKAGSAQTRKTYARHGAAEPMFGVSFATLKALTKRINIDHELALALWATGNFDARNLAVKIVDPAQMSPADLDRWAREVSASRMCGGYAAMLASETPHGAAKAAEWIASTDCGVRVSGWTLLAQLALRDEAIADAVFEKRLAQIERTIHTAPNSERGAMNVAVVCIGCRSAGLRKAALTTAARIGKVEVDHGDTACKTPDAAQYIVASWKHSAAKRFPSPAAQERSREVPRRRC